MAITFICPSCRKQLQVSDGAAGRSGRCPHCQGALVVPSPTAISEAPTATWTGEPPRAAGQSKTWIYVTAGVAVLLVAGLVAGAFYFLGGGGGVAATNEAITYLPDDCHVVAVLRVAQANKSNAFKELKALSKDVPGANALPTDIEKQAEKMGLALDNIEQVTLGMSFTNVDIANPTAQKPIFVVRTREPIKADEIKAKLKEQKFTEAQASGRALSENLDLDMAVCIIDPNTIVAGPAGPAIRKVLERNGKPKLGETMQFALKEMGAPKTIGLAVSLKEALGRPDVKELAKRNEQAAKYIGDLDAAVLQLTLGNDIDINLTVFCKSADTAKELNDLVNGLLALLKIGAGKDMPPDLAELLNALSITADGPKLQAVLALKTATLVKLSKQAPKFGP